uniref:Uncharacterized protein n=1 Tax=Branchiostoma floridae TaxID=7739 RepID=C3ZS50_BRAFL|eukprot:XP_002588618.1 hypothetical protein BRAFLDRAFT_106854 [Branchiostoma floridae]
MKPRMREYYRAHKLAFWMEWLPSIVKPRTSPTPSIDQYRPGSAICPNFTPTKGPWKPGPGIAGIGDLFGTQPPQQDHSRELSITIAVGTSLLLINIVVFALLYYRRDKRKRNDEKDTPGLMHKMQTNHCTNSPTIRIVEMRDANLPITISQKCLSKKDGGKCLFSKSGSTTWNRYTPGGRQYVYVNKDSKFAGDTFYRAMKVAFWTELVESWQKAPYNASRPPPASSPPGPTCPPRSFPRDRNSVWVPNPSPRIPFPTAPKARKTASDNFSLAIAIGLCLLVINIIVMVVCYIRCRNTDKETEEPTIPDINPDSPTIVHAARLGSRGLHEAIIPTSSTEDALMPPESTKVLPMGEPSKIIKLPLINGPLRLPNGDAIVPVAVEKEGPVPPPPFDVDDHVVL